MKALEGWFTVMASGQSEGLYELLHPDCTFWSPVVHTPQRGRDITFAYLSAAQRVFHDEFTYVRQVIDVPHAVLEFQCRMGDIWVNGIDMLTEEEGQIIDFKVMIRPLKAVHTVHEKMGEMLLALREMPA